MKKTMKKGLALLLSLMLAISMLNTRYLLPVAQAASLFEQRVSQLREKFPNNKYWNHAVYADSQRADVLLENWDNSYGDSTTWTPCATHNGQPDYGQCDCNAFDGGIQCWGFANRIFYGIFGVYASTVSNRSDTQNVSVGDWIRLENENHSAVVLTRNGDWLTIVEGNRDGNCKIVWDRQIHISTINWFKHAPNWNDFFIHTHNYTSATITSAPTRISNGTRLWKCACGATKTQTIPAIPYTTGLKEGIYTITTKCKAESNIAVNRDYDDNVKIWDGAAADQHWLFHKNTDGTYSIENAFYRGYYLTIENMSMVNEGNLIVYQRTGGDNQKFYVIPDVGGYYRLVVKHSYMTIDLWNADPSNNTNIAQHEDNGTNAQRWALTLSNPSLSVSVSSVTVAAGNSKTVNCTIGAAYGYMFVPTVSDSSVCSANMGSDMGNWTYPLTITGKSGGNATVTVALKDKNSDIVYNTKTITVTVSETVKPAVSISSTNNAADSQTVTLSMSDNAGLAGYYWGTSSSYADNTYTPVSGTSTSVTKTVSSAGTYYLTAKDTSGNVSSTVFKTFFKTTLNANSGSVSPVSVLTMSGNSFTLPMPTRDGYTFKNWNTSLGGSGTAYTGSYKPTGSTTLYAVWEKDAVTLYTLTYNANGGTDAPASQAGNGSVTLSYDQPTRDGYAFLGWAKSSAATAAQYAPGAAYNLTENTTLFAVWQKNETPDTPPAAEPTIAIRNYTQNKTVDYRTTITFGVDPVQNPVSGAQVHWFMDGQDQSTGDSFTVIEAKESYTIQAKYIKDGTVLAESQTEKVTVKTGFFARLKAFFRALFGTLPKQVQEAYELNRILDFLP